MHTNRLLFLGGYNIIIMTMSPPAVQCHDIVYRRRYILIILLKYSGKNLIVTSERVFFNRGHDVANGAKFTDTAADPG